MRARDFEWALWVGNEVEGPHVGKKTLFVMGEDVPVYSLVRYQRETQCEVVYFGAGRRYDINWYLVALMVGQVGLVVVEVKDLCIIPIPCQELIERHALELVHTLTNPACIPDRVKFEDMDNSRIYVFEETQCLSEVKFGEMLVEGDEFLAGQKSGDTNP